MFGDTHAYGEEGVRFYTRQKSIMQRWPDSTPKGAGILHAGRALGAAEPPVGPHPPLGLRRQRSAAVPSRRKRSWTRAPFLEGDYDYIVVGAGLRRLACWRTGFRPIPAPASWCWRAAGATTGSEFHIPVGYLYAIGNPRADWMFATEAEAGLNGRSLAYPRGKVIGGCSAINGMISMRGQSADYDHWRQLGLTGWGWDDVLPTFRKLDDHFLGDTEHHGVGGDWRVEEMRLNWPVLDAVASAAVEAGAPRLANFNTGDNEGVGYFHVNQKAWDSLVGGARFSSSRPLKRPNLRLETGVAGRQGAVRGTPAR